MSIQTDIDAIDATKPTYTALTKSLAGLGQARTNFAKIKAVLQALYDGSLLPSQGNGATKNVISVDTTINANESYVVIDYLRIDAVFTVNGVVKIL